MTLPAPTIGNQTRIPGWPTNDIPGMFEALKLWCLEARLDYTADPCLPDREPGHAPFRTGPGPKTFGTQRYLPSIGRVAFYGSDTLVYPDHPEAVQYCFGFLGYSFHVNLWTDDKDLIQRLDAAIAENMSRDDYKEDAIRQSRQHADRYGAAWKGWPEGHPCHGIDTHVLIKE